MAPFNNPLDNIRVASPCPVNWDEMFGNERKRFCSECKLNVYNLSDMTRREAENLLIESEGRLCVRFFRRADGTVLTQNCPVGWKAVKARTSKVVAAAFSIVIGFISGLFALRVTETMISTLPIGDVPSPQINIKQEEFGPVIGQIELAKPNSKKTAGYEVVGRVVEIEQMHKKKVVAWVE